MPNRTLCGLMLLTWAALLPGSSSSEAFQRPRDARAEAEGGEAAAPELRVMSFNIRYGTANDGENAWEKRKALLVETIQAFDPDLLGTQETLAFQRDELARALPDYDVLGVGRDDGQERGEMMAVYYRKGRFTRLAGGHFWLSETPEQAGSKSWDSALPRMATWVKLRDKRLPESAPPLAWFNTHFDHRGPQARLESAKLLRRKILELGENCAVIVTGDFNAGEASEPYRALFGQAEDDAPSPIVDAFRTRHPRPGSHEGTYSGFDAKPSDGPRIDWIGVSRDWEIAAAAIDRTAKNGRTPSDHFPVTATLRIRAAEADASLQNAGERAARKVYEVETVANIRYHTGPDNSAKQKLDLYLPQGKTGFPVLFFIHGGGWVSGDRKLYTLFGRRMARQGLGTVVISYRLTPEVKHPGHIEDVARAFAWTHANIERYGGRHDRIYVTGQSAGGHLAALLGTNEKYLKAHGLSLDNIRGVIPVSGIYEFDPRWGGLITGRSRTAADDASPLRQITGREPPFLLLYASRDIPGCDRKSREMCEKLVQKGADADVREIPGRDHITVILRPMFSDRDPLVQEILEFVEGH